MRLFCISDVHADASTSGFDRFDEIAAAAWAAADDAARFRREGGDAMFAFLGDLCDPDTTRAFRAVSLAIDIALSLSVAKVPSLWIAGNHDVIENERGSTVLEPLHAATKIVPGAPVFVEDEACCVPDAVLFDREKDWNPKTGTVFFLLPYVARTKAYDPADWIESAAHPIYPDVARVVVLGHLTVPSAERGSESDDFARGRDLVFPVEACRHRWGDRVLMLNGHYHRRQVTRDGVIIPGSLARLRHDEETHEPGYLVIDL